MKKKLDIFIDGHKNRAGRLYALCYCKNSLLEYTAICSVSDHSFENAEQAEWLSLLHAYKFSDNFSFLGFKTEIHTHSKSILDYYNCGFSDINEIPDSKLHLYDMAGFSEYLPTFYKTKITKCKKNENMAHLLAKETKNAFCMVDNLHIYDEDLANSYNEYKSMPELKKTILKLETECDHPDTCDNCQKNLDGRCDVPILKELYYQKYHCAL